MGLKVAGAISSSAAPFMETADPASRAGQDPLRDQPLWPSILPKFPYQQPRDHVGKWARPAVHFEEDQISAAGTAEPQRWP